MSRGLRPEAFRDVRALRCGLTQQMLTEAVAFAYGVLDGFDETLQKSGLGHFAKLVELANLSTVLGHLVGRGIIRSSGGVFDPAGPHKYQDLRSARASGCHIEIKTALETNRPKGHLPKEGYYLTQRYVLCGKDKRFQRKVRQEVVWIWEMRFGYLELADFAISSTSGDSGKTALVKSASMAKLAIIYYDDELLPYVRARTEYEF